MAKLKSPDELKMDLARNPTEQLKAFTSFTIDETILGIRYQGLFNFKVPTVADQIMIGQMKNNYLPNGGKADPQSELLVEQICYLSVTLQDPKPVWWKPMEFTATDLISKLYLEALAYANRFLGRNTDTGANSGSNESQDDGSDALGDESAMGENLQRPNERSKVTLAHASRVK